MFGIYEYFPEAHHGVANFSHKESTQAIQRLIIHSLYQMNIGEEELPNFTKSNIKTTLEFGIADGIIFNYLDKEILRLYREKYAKETFSTLDFICIARYYVPKDKRKKPLRFDYYLLRFILHEGKFDLQVFHEKGTRRLPIEELITLMTEKINNELTKKSSHSIKKNYLHAY